MHIWYFLLCWKIHKYYFNNKQEWGIIYAPIPLLILKIICWKSFNISLIIVLKNCRNNKILVFKIIYYKLNKIKVGKTINLNNFLNIRFLYAQKIIFRVEY